MKKKLCLAAFIFCGLFARSQHLGSTPEYIKMLTWKWEGERFADGRPKVSDGILERLGVVVD